MYKEGGGESVEIGYDSFSEPTGFHLARGRDELDGEDCDANVRGKRKEKG